MNRFAAELLRVEFDALAALLICSALNALFAVAESTGATPLLSGGDAAKVVFLYTLVLGVIPVLFLGAPKMLLAYKQRVSWPAVTWSVAGSQVLEELEVTIDGSLLRIEAETYMGLSIKGPAAIVG